MKTIQTPKNGVFPASRFPLRAGGTKLGGIAAALARSLRLVVLGVPAVVALTTPLVAEDSTPSGELATGERTYLLVESPEATRRTQVGLSYEVGGQLSLMQDNQVTRLPMTVQARLAYHDERLSAEDRVEEGRLKITRRHLRHIDRAEVTIHIHNGKFEPELRPERSLIGIEISDSRRTTFSPTGRLTRDELDLVEPAGDSLLLGLLLPERRVALGDTWEIPDETLALLLGLDAVGQGHVSGVLAEVHDGTARIEIAGLVLGAVGGVATEIELKARLRFDLRQQIVSQLELVTRESKAIGHIGPGVEATAKLRLQRRPLTQEGKLTRQVVDSVEFPPHEELALLDFEPAHARFDLVHHRDWHVTADQRQATILRLVRRGELVAQCNITPLSTRVEGVPGSLEEFREGIQVTLGERFGRFLEASREQISERTIYRVVAAGRVGELPIRYIYYLIKREDDHRIATLSFTVEESLVETLGEADQQLARRLLLRAASESDPQPAQETARDGSATPR